MRTGGSAAASDRRCAEHIDIAEDDALIESYGTRIPVLRREDNGAELGWPFDAAAVQGFIA